MSDRTLELVNDIMSRLAATVRRISIAEALLGVAITLGGAAIVWVIAALLESGLWLPSGARIVIFVLAMLAIGGLFSWFAAPPILRLIGILPPLPEETIAHRIGVRYPEVGDRLVNMIHLSHGRGTNSPAVLVDRAVWMLGTQVRPVQFEGIEDFSRPRRAGMYAAIPFAVLVLFVAIAPGSFFGASHRLVAFATDFERPAAYVLSVEPGSVEIVRGDPVEAVVRARGRKRPERVILAIKRPEEEKIEQLELVPDDTGDFRHSMPSVRRPFRYRAETPQAVSEWFDVTVHERPMPRGLRVTLRYPSYTGLGLRELEPNVGDVTALSGTQVQVDVGLGAQQITRARLVFEDSRTQELEMNGGSATGTFTLARAGTYHVELESATGVASADPVVYKLEAIPDEPPTIVFTSPDAVEELGSQMQVPIAARIRDDFGFSSLGLHYRLAESRYKATSDTFTVIPLEIPGAEPDQSFAYAWMVSQVTRIDPVPGDVIEYYLRVRDNDAIAGFKAATTERYRLVVPSLAERYRDLDRQQDQAQTEIEDILREADEIRSQFEELRNELRRKQEGDWDDQRQLEQVQQRQEEVERRVEELGRSLDQMTREMDQNGLVSDETLDLYRELQHVVDEINSPELREALKRLQEAVQNLNLDQIQQSIGEFEFNEQQYRDRLERTLELFKNLRLQQELDAAARRAEELARQQERLAAQTQELMRNEGSEGAEQDKHTGAEQEDSDSDQADSDSPQEQDQNDGDTGEESSDSPRNSPDDLAREQERSRQEMQDLEEMLENLARSMDDMKRAPRAPMEQLIQELKQQDLPGQMDKNAQELREEQLQDARQGQQRMQEQLQQAAAQMQQMQQSMAGNQAQVNAAGIRRALADVLTLSHQQEQARERVTQAPHDGPQMREFAQDQLRLGESLAIVADSLQRLSREIPQMSRAVQQYAGESLREMGSATSSLADRSARQGATHQKGAMMQLNELALLLSELLNQMSGGEGQGSPSMSQMIQQLQQLAGQQEQINREIQQLLNDAQGNRLTTDANRRLQQLGEQQSAIRQQLREISRNPEARGRLLGDLDKIAEQMEETIQELQLSQADRRTIERQQEILTRLLDAQKSMRERGREERREGRSADDVVRESPPDLPTDEALEKLRRDLLRALEAGYAPEYQDLIKRYFELLQQERIPAAVPGESED